jgi:hypothetical protein
MRIPATSRARAIRSCSRSGARPQRRLALGVEAATFAALGLDATYTPAGGEPIDVRVIAKRPDAIVGFGETRTHTETASFELRASEVASPRPGDQLTVGDQTFVIQGEPERRDPDRLVWTLDVRPA